MEKNNKTKKIKLKSISRKKLSTIIANQILQLIRDGTLKPGDRVPTEKKLIKELSVSRTAVREGMKSLEMMGIIEIYPGQGTFVSKNRKTSNLILHLLRSDEKIKKNILLDLLELRQILEVGIVDIVAKKGTKEDFSKLRKSIELHRIDIEKDKHPSHGDLAFHRLLAASTHNKMIIDFYEGIYDLIKGSLIFTGDVKKNRIIGFKFHEKIYNAIIKKDSKLAREAMRNHIEWIKGIITKKKKL